MISNDNIFENVREIPDSFMVDGSNADGTDKNDNVCMIVGNTDQHMNTQGKPRGVLIGSTSDDATLARLRFMPPAGNNIVSCDYALGVEHHISIKYLYPGTNARRVRILY